MSARGQHSVQVAYQPGPMNGRDAHHLYPKGLSRSDCREVAHSTGAVYTVVDLPESPESPHPPKEEPLNDTGTYGWAVKQAKPREDIYHPTLNYYGVQPIDEVEAREMGYLAQESRKRDIKDRQEQEQLLRRFRSGHAVPCHYCGMPMELDENERDENGDKLETPRLYCPSCEGETQ